MFALGPMARAVLSQRDNLPEVRRQSEAATALCLEGSFGHIPTSERLAKAGATLRSAPALQSTRRGQRPLGQIPMGYPLNTA